MNSAGCTIPRRRVLPAHERLHAGHVAPAQIHDRLVAERELAAVERPLQVALELEPGERPRVHVGLEDLVVALAVLLGHVHGRVGVAQQLLGVGLADHRGVAEGDPDAGRDRDVAVLERDRGLQGVHHALGDLDRLHLVLGLVQQDRELVAAEAGGRVDGPHRVLQAASDLPEHDVAGGVAEAVVDVLEVVDVHEQDRHRQVVAALAGERVADAVAEQGAVGQAGEDVVEGLVLELRPRTPCAR